MATIDELRARAELIAEEQQIGGNTAERVGDAFDMVADIIEAVAPGDQQAVLYNPQSPNEAQKAQARENIGAQETISDIADFVKVSAQTFTAAQKQQARENIGAEQAGGAVKNLAGSASDTETLIKAANNPNLQANVHLSGNNIYINGIAGGIDFDNNGVNLKAGNSGYPNAKVKVNGQDVATELYVDGKIDDRADPIEVALAAIEAVIPSQASAQNQLADKSFVNSSISSSTANFVGTFNSLSELQAVQNPTNNDYGFVIETDAVGNEYYDRYKYNGQAWLFEYKVESTPFTAAQWAAIQSGITSALVTKLSALPTNAELTTALDAKADKSDTYTKAQVDAAIAAIDVSSQISGKADKVANAVNGDFAALDANGNLVDSGKKATDFATAAQGAKADGALQAPSGGTTGQVLTKTVGGVAWEDADPTAIQEAVDDWLDEHSSSVAGMTYEAKRALMECFANVAWINSNGQQLYNALYNALFNTAPTVVSISAFFNADGNIIYTDDSLDSLRQYITVTAHYSDGTSAVVSTYTLSGTLVEGTSTITATYSEATTTITINDVVDFYNIFNWSTEFTGVGKLTKNKAIYDVDSYNPRRGFRTKTGVNTRFGVGVEKGRQASYDETTSNYTNEFPVPIPKTATKVTINVTPATDYLFGYVGRYAAGGEGGYDYTMLNEAATWTHQGTYTCTFEAGENLFLGYNGKKSNGASYTGSERANRVVTITFE